jgi:phosphatidylinositol-3-phosphatase
MRRGGLPATVAELIGASTNCALYPHHMARGGMEASTRAGQNTGASDSIGRDSAARNAAGWEAAGWNTLSEDPSRGGQIAGLAMPTPAVAAVAVMALLAFGVLVGSAVSPVAPSGAAAPILLAITQAAKAVKPAPVSEAQAPPTTEAATPAVTATTEAAPTSTTKTPTPSAAKGKEKGEGTTTPSGADKEPPIKHVFLIVLSDQGAEAAFGPSSSAPYLAKTLTGEGELLENYYAVGEGELANAIALISGQGPTPQTTSDCPQYTDLTPGTVGAEGQVLGSGCVYPRPTLTLADQLAGAGKTWKAYVEGIEAAGPGQPASCRHPTLGASDPSNTPNPGDAYVTWRNPFVYFHSLIDGTECAQDDVGLGQLTSDLKAASTTPSLAYVVPGRCSDSSETLCVPGQRTGLQAAEAFLRKVVPEIKASAAYKEGGLIAITFDQAPRTGPGADSRGCCMTTTYPNLPAAAPTNAPPTAASPTTTSAATTPSTTMSPTTTPTTGATTPTTPPTTSTSGASTSGTSTNGMGTSGVSGAQPPTPAGGGRVGLLLISRYVKPGTLNVTGEYNHFALLRSIENLFGLNPLGYAAAPGLLAFDSSVFNAYK